MTEHELKISPAVESLPAVGRCSCRLFSMVAPEDLIRSFHAAHLLYPDTSLKAKSGEGRMPSHEFWATYDPLDKDETIEP